MNNSYWINAKVILGEIGFWQNNIGDYYLCKSPHDYFYIELFENEKNIHIEYLLETKIVSMKVRMIEKNLKNIICDFINRFWIEIPNQKEINSNILREFFI